MGSLLHLITTERWRAALGTGVLPPDPAAGFVHLSRSDQVTLPADRLFPGRDDVVLLAVDPAGLDVRDEPGLPTDPAGMLFPHAYGPVPTSAVVAVLPYRPGPDGRFPGPAPVPARAAHPARATGFEPSVLRRAATAEVPVTGGVAVLTDDVPASYTHNQLVVTDPATDAATVAAEAERVLGGAGHRHRKALLPPGADAAAAGLAARGWAVVHLVTMAAVPGGDPDPRAAVVRRAVVRPYWDAMWRRDEPGVTDAELTQLTERYALEERVVDVRHLAVVEPTGVVATAVVRIDGATAQLDAVSTDPAHRGRGLGDALVTTALAVAGEAGCDLLCLDADAGDFPRRWYARRGFTEVAEVWTAARAATDT